MPWHKTSTPEIKGKRSSVRLPSAPQPLWQPPSTACLPASGAASEVPSLPMHLCSPSCPDMHQVLVQGAKMRKHGVPVFGQARVTARHVPRNTCCAHNPTLPLHDYKVVPNTPAHTPEHRSTRNYTHTDTFPPTWTLPAPAQRYKPPYLLDWNRKSGGSKKKAQKCRNTGLMCLHKPALGQSGGGGVPLVHGKHLQHLEGQSPGCAAGLTPQSPPPPPCTANVPHRTWMYPRKLGELR